MRSLSCFSFVPLVFCTLVSQDKVQAILPAEDNRLPSPTSEQTLAVETLNGFRSIHGLGPVTLDKRLLASSAKQAALMSKKKVLAHKGEDKESENAMQRAGAFGYSGPVAELVASGIPSAPYAVVSFMDAPYHRRLLLKPGKLDFGCSVQDSYACFVLGGDSDRSVVFSPPNGAQGVPTYWDGREEPSPMRGTGLKPPYGYPIMLAAYGFEGRLDCRRAKLTDQNGGTVSCTVRNPSNDPEAKNSVILIPTAPLKASTAYTVSVMFELDDESHQETWSFRTGSEQAPDPVPVRKHRKG